MRMWDRSVNSSEYKYGFNGKEKDDELKGEGNSYDFGARIYDPRIGRFLSIDPKSANYVSVSPYHFASNNPIYFIDSKGENSEGYIGKDGKLYITATYHAVSEGVDSYSEIEMRQIEETVNQFWSQAVGMKVVLADGKEVEVGGVKIIVVPGGDYSASANAAQETGQNLLIKGTKQQIEKLSEEGRAEAVSTSLAASETKNLTVLNKENVGKGLVGDEADVRNNAYNDETGHIMGTTHGKRKEGESFSAFSKRNEAELGDLERGLTNATGELKLSQKDVQHVVDSDEFKLINN
jgi:RHS repeat-associated protein